MKKICKFAVLAAGLLLAGCSLGAKQVSLDAFKDMFNKEIKVTAISDVKASLASVSVKEEERDVNAKTLVENSYNINASGYQEMTTLDLLQKGDSSISSEHTVTNYVTKEIVNSAGIKTYTDVEKTQVKVKKTLAIEKDSDNYQIKHLTSSVLNETITMKTDYLTVSLDVSTGGVANAEIIVDDDLFTLGKDVVVVFDEFEEKESGEEEEGGDDTAKEVVISLAGRTWTLKDSTGTYKDAVIAIDEQIDSISSSQTKVGTITYNKIEHDLFVFEKADDGSSYNFEIREIQEDGKDPVKTEIAQVQLDQAAIDSTIKPKIDEFLADAEVSANVNEVLGKYNDVLTYIEGTLDGNYKREILQRETGMVYRVMEESKYREALIGALKEETSTRPITRYVERQGLSGNNITTYSFIGF